MSRYQNQAIIFTGDDMGGRQGDDGHASLYCYCDHGICLWYYDWQYDYKEAGVIGTLRASGYTGNELIRHYMTLPVLVTLAGALAGNVLDICCVQRRLCGDVLWKLQPSDICNGLECRSFSYDDSDTDRNHGTGELWNPSSQNAAFPH